MPADVQTIDQAFLDTKTEEERMQIVLDLLDRLENALIEVSHPLKVLVAIRFAATYALANKVGLQPFLVATRRIFIETREDLIAHDLIQKKAPP